MTPSRSTNTAIARFWATILALFLGYPFVVVEIQELWRDHWLVKDGQQGIAVVTKESGHGAVVYEYRVGETVYTGEDHRSIQNPKYSQVMPGGKSVVYFSSSHPWLSAINPPQHVMITGLPVVLLVWLIEAGLVVTIINPRSRWAFNFTGWRAPLAALEPGRSRAKEITFANDKLRLLGWGMLIVFAMAAIELAIDALFGRK